MNMRDENELAKKLVIDFPSPLSLGDARGPLLDHLKGIGCDTTYTYCLQGIVREVGGQTYRRENLVSFGGIMARSNEELTQLQFEMRRDYDDDKEEGFITGITFSTLGWDLNEMPERDFKLMDDIREAIGKYFPQRSHSD